MAPVSQNGWPVDPPRSSRTIPGTTVRVTVADGPAGDVLMYVLAQIDRRVEDIDLKSTRGEFDDWGYANRNVRGSTAVSNHASATAVDVNATRHVLGQRDTFDRTQVAEIHKILAEVDHVVRWGGDYTGRKDEMHFEIDASASRVAAVAQKIKGKAAVPMSGITPGDANVLYSAEIWLRYKSESEAKAAGLPVVGGKQVMVEKHSFGEWFAVLCRRVGLSLTEQQEQTSLLREIRDDARKKGV